MTVARIPGQSLGNLSNYWDSAAVPPGSTQRFWNLSGYVFEMGSFYSRDFCGNLFVKVFVSRQNPWGVGRTHCWSTGKVVYSSHVFGNEILSVRWALLSSKEDSSNYFTRCVSSSTSLQEINGKVIFAAAGLCGLRVETFCFEDEYIRISNWIRFSKNSITRTFRRNCKTLDLCLQVLGTTLFRPFLTQSYFPNVGTYLMFEQDCCEKLVHRFSFQFCVTHSLRVLEISFARTNEIEL